MKLKVQLIIESDSGETEVVQEVGKLERHSLRPENLGLTLSEAKELLQEVQKAMVTHQTTRYLTQQISCPECGGIRSHKGKHQIVLRTLFGKLRLDSGYIEANQNFIPNYGDRYGLPVAMERKVTLSARSQRKCRS